MLSWSSKNINVRVLLSDFPTSPLDRQIVVLPTGAQNLASVFMQNSNINPILPTPLVPLNPSNFTPTPISINPPIPINFNPTSIAPKWGSWHCDKFRGGGKCDVCNHMVEKETIESFYYITKFKIHGHLRHDYNPDGKIRWFIYCVEDIPCKKVIIGSTQNPKQRWSNYKSCLLYTSPSPRDS